MTSSAPAPISAKSSYACNDECNTCTLSIQELKAVGFGQIDKTDMNFFESSKSADDLYYSF